MTMHDNRAAQAMTDATHADANADHMAAQQQAPPPTPEPAHAPTDAPTPTQAPPSDPAYTNEPPAVHEQAGQALDFSDLQPDPPGHTNPLAAIRDAVVEYRDERLRERAAEDSHTLPAETARRWHRAHKDTQTPRRKRGRDGWRR